MATIERATPEQVRALIPRLRAPDAAELELGGPLTESEILGSSDLWMGFADGEPACAWGAYRLGPVNPASLWLITTPLIEKHKVAFLRNSKRVVRTLLERYGALTGLVQESNAPAREFAAFVGLKVGEPFEAPPLGLVRRFEGRL